MGRKKTILIIEQESNLAGGLKRILEKQGYNAVALYNSHDVRKLCQDAIPDLAIININVPKEFGLNILRRTKEDFPRLPIVAVSVYSNYFSRSELSRLGVNDFIAKPFDVNYLKSRIEKLVGAHNY
jgi:DNA-binding response OmpR family regulator